MASGIIAEKQLFDRSQAEWSRRIYDEQATPSTAVEEDRPLLSRTEIGWGFAEDGKPMSVSREALEIERPSRVCLEEKRFWPATLESGLPQAGRQQGPSTALRAAKLLDPAGLDCLQLERAETGQPRATTLPTARVEAIIETEAAGSIHLHLADNKASGSPPKPPPGAEQQDTAVFLDLEESDEPQDAGAENLPLYYASCDCIAIVATLLLTAAGLLCLHLAPLQLWGRLELWRWCFFLAGLAPVWYLSSVLVRGLLLTLEARLFTVQQAFYFIVAIKSPATMLLRAVMLIPLFVVAFAEGGSRLAEGQLAYTSALRALACLVLFAAGNLLKTLLAKLLASHVHRSAFFAKMQDALQKEYYLHALSQPRRRTDVDMASAALAIPTSHEWQAVQVEMRERSTATSHHRRSHSFSGAWQRAAKGLPRPWLVASGRLQGMDPGRDAPLSKADGRPGGGLSQPHAVEAGGRLPPLEADTQQWARRVAQLERHMRENKLRQNTSFADELGRAESEWDEVRSKKEAKRMAFDIFWNARADYSRNYIVFEDLLSFLPASKALAALKVLDGDGDGKVSPPDMRDAVLNIYKERKHLAATLSDTRSVVGKMENTFAAIIHVVLIFFYLAVFQVNVQQVWLSFSSGVLAFVFIFGNNIRNLYEACLLLFVVHPFDVGDVVFLNNDQWCQVMEISLQCTLFQRWDGIRIYYPNARLSNEPILNVSRSANRWEGFKVHVDISTPAAVFERVDAAVTAHFKANPTEYSGEKLVVANNASDPLKFTLCVFWEYSHSGAELGRMSRARHALYMVISKALVQANASYHLPPYEGMEVHTMSHGLRPPGEGSPFMPIYLRKPELKL